MKWTLFFQILMLIVILWLIITAIISHYFEQKTLSKKAWNDSVYMDRRSEPPPT